MLAMLKSPLSAHLTAVIHGRHYTKSGGFAMTFRSVVWGIFKFGFNIYTIYYTKYYTKFSILYVYIQNFISSPEIEQLTV